MKYSKLRTTALVCFIFMSSIVFLSSSAFARRTKTISQIPGRFVSVEDDLGARGGPLSQHRTQIREVLITELLKSVIGNITEDTPWREKLIDYMEIVSNSLVRNNSGTLEQLESAGIITEEIRSFLLGIDNFSTADVRALNLVPLADRIVELINGYYDNPIHQFTQVQVDTLLKKLVSWQDIQWLAEEFEISLSDAMRVVIDYSSPLEWLNANVSLAGQLSEKFDISLGDAMYVVTRHSHPLEWLNANVPLAGHLAEEFEISLSDAMRAVINYNNPREWLTTNMPLVMKLLGAYEDFGATSSLCMEAVKKKNPEEWLRKNLELS
ncbi:MAG: hypothetical protein P9X27_06900 [Candidatus Kaelpia aquatica]|nr:hypothetical protein [Candidatus Kaelpia aquatica]